MKRVRKAKNNFWTRFLRKKQNKSNYPRQNFQTPVYQSVPVYQPVVYQPQVVFQQEKRGIIRRVRTDPDFLSVPQNNTEATLKELNGMAQNWYELYADEYFNLLDNRSRCKINFDFTGIYLIYNVWRDEYYVGQSKSVLKRLKQHFTGYGNPDVYYDYRNGEEFRIQTLSLTASEYLSLNKLEKDAIAVYSAYYNGYNQTSGNQD